MLFRGLQLRASSVARHLVSFVSSIFVLLYIELEKLHLPDALEAAAGEELRRQAVSLAKYAAFSCVYWAAEKVISRVQRWWKRRQAIKPYTLDREARPQRRESDEPQQSAGPNMDRMHYTDRWSFQPAGLDLSKLRSMCKVWVMGRFKVGKTFVVEKCLDREVLTSTGPTYTRGEVFIPDERSGLLFVDTEGFEQVIDTKEPQLRSMFVQKHAMESADVVLLVLPLLTIQDRQLMFKLIDFVNRDGHFRLLVVHNLVHFQTIDQVKDYRDALARYIKEEEGRETFLMGERLVTSNGRSSVWQYFLGDDRYLASFNTESINQMRSVWAQPQMRNIDVLEATRKALQKTYFWAYNVSEEPKVEEGKEGAHGTALEVQYSTHGPRRMQFNGHVIHGNTLEYHWSKPMLLEEGVFQYLIINQTRVLPDTFRFKYEDERTLCLDFSQIKVTTNVDGKDHKGILTDQKELIIAQHDMQSSQLLAAAILASKEQLETGELRYRVPLQESKIFRQKLEKQLEEQRAKTAARMAPVPDGEANELKAGDGIRRRGQAQ